MAMEPVDVENGEFVVYDSEGRAVTPSVVKERGGWPVGLLGFQTERAAIDASKASVPNQDEFRELLANFLRSIGDSIGETESVSLEDLLARAVQRSGWQPSAK